MRAVGRVKQRMGTRGTRDREENGMSRRREGWRGRKKDEDEGNQEREDNRNVLKKGRMKK